MTTRNPPLQLVANNNLTARASSEPHSQCEGQERGNEMPPLIHPESPGGLNDLDQAISMFREAVNLTPDRHRAKARHLNNLANSLLTRFRYLGDLRALEQAISIYQDAINLFPHGHPHKPSSFRALSDLEQAILRYMEAIDLTPEGHPDEVGLLNNLASAIVTHFERLMEQSDPKQAMSSSTSTFSMGQFRRPIFIIYRAICDLLEGDNRVAEAIMWFHQMQSALVEDTSIRDQRAQWELDFRKLCVEKLEKLGDVAMGSKNHDEAVKHYSDALTFEVTEPNARLPEPSTASNRDTRKFIDIVWQTSGNWTNWDPPIPIAVGDYGTLDENGELIVEGNIYDTEFQRRLDKNGFQLDLKVHLPELSDPEQDYVVASTGVKREEFEVDQAINVPGIASASVKGTWNFPRGKRGALVILYNLRQKFIPKQPVQTKILESTLLEGKKLVTSVFACSAYLHSLSDKSGESVSVAFCDGADPAVTSGLGLGWWTNNESALMRRVFNPKGEQCFIPLFSLCQRVSSARRFSRIEDETESSPEYVWQDVSPPWRPLDEDGEEVGF